MRFEAIPAPETTVKPHFDVDVHATEQDAVRSADAADAAKARCVAFFRENFPEFQRVRATAPCGATPCPLVDGARCPTFDLHRSTLQLLQRFYPHTLPRGGSREDLLRLLSSVFLLA